MYCTKCGTLSQPSELQCSACGQPLPVAAETGGPFMPISNHLAFAILLTVLSLFCCLVALPFGIISIVYAAKVDTKRKAGDYQGASISSKKAKIWCWITLVVGIIAFILLILAAIAIPQFIRFHTRAQTIQTQTVLKQACSLVQAIFIVSPDKRITLDDLTESNIRIPPGMEFSIEDGSAENFTVILVNKNIGKTFVMKRDCTIQEFHVAK